MNQGNESSGEEPPKPPVKKVKEQRAVLARSITSDWIIESEEDLDKYMDSMKKQILAQLDDDHSVLITF